ncbi:MAG: hypothetical protein ACRYFX_22720 [Janthinobacterium lividum]
MFAIYNVATGAKVPLTGINYSQALIANSYNIVVPQTTITGCLQPPVPPGCATTGAAIQPYKLQTFVAVVNLPKAAAGYYAYYTDSARDFQAYTNIIYNNATGSLGWLTLYTTLAPAAYANHSPVFTTSAIALVCLNDTTTLLSGAVDPDGDRLVYTFGTPYSDVAPWNQGFTLPLASVLYTTTPAPGGYSAATPFGAAPNFARIAPTTGLATYYATVAGHQYVVAVDVQEYRRVNGQDVLIGTTRRDIQLAVATCPPTAPPVLTAGAGPGFATSYTVEASATLTIPLAATQPAGHPLELTVNSGLLDGVGGAYAATFAGQAGTPTVAGSPVGTATLSGSAGSVAGSFVFAPTCAQARTTPYDVAVQVQDQGCAGKRTARVLRISVVLPPGPAAVQGPATVCALGVPQPYTARGGTAPGMVWRIRDGGGALYAGATLVPGPAPGAVQVSWPAAGTYTLTAQGVSAYGCPTDTAVATVVVAPAPALTVAGPATICAGSSATLTVGSAPGPYVLTGGGISLSGPGPFVVAPTQTTTYTLSGAATGAGCVPTAPATVAVGPLPAAATGPPVSTCAGVSVGLGAAPVAGHTYSWAPATGLSSARVASPTLTLPNPTGSPLTLTYMLTETTPAGCPATGTVAVTVQPLPAAVPGAALTLCTGSPGQLGGPAVAGTTYQWSPATGLSSATSANPTLTLPNSTGSSLLLTYTLTATSAAGCMATGTVAVTVGPALAPGRIGADQTLCPPALPAALTELAPASGGPGPYTYAWEASSDGLNWTPLAGATGPGYAPAAPAATTYYRRRVQSGDCPAAVSNAVAVQVLSVPAPTVAMSIRTPLPACAGEALAFGLDATTNAGSAPAYQWQVAGQPVPGATAATFTSATLLDGRP